MNSSKSIRVIIAIMLAILLVAETGGFETSNVYAASKMAAPRITKLQYYQSSDGSYNAMLYWNAKKGRTYQVLRKEAESKKWNVIGRVKADSKKGVFKNSDIGPNAAYYYTVRRVKIKGGKIKARGKYDKKGLKTIGMPAMSVDFTNLRATIKWKKVKGASNYLVYRKIGPDDSNTLIAKVSSDKTKYVDVYAKSSKNPKMSALLTSEVFVDPSNNPISYTVRPYYKGKVGKVKKESYGLYLRDGEYHLEAPTIVDLSSDGTLQWGTVPNADGYIILKKDGNDGEWYEHLNVEAESEPSKYQSAKIELGGRDTYYAVRSYTNKNGEIEYSDYDPSFTLKYRGIGSGSNVLFLGDSMTFGSPYYNVQRGYFSYPHRVQQLTGISMFNPSIPGSTWRYHPDSSRYRIVNGVAGMIAIGETTDYAFGPLKIGFNKQKFEDFDIVLLAAGTNDYQDKTKTNFGERETDWEKITDKTENLSFTVNAGYEQAKTYTGMNYDYNIGTFDGAYNQIIKYIEEASIIRVLHGKPPIKVVAMSLFYSDRTYPYSEIHNRNVTKNKLGYTMLDYQKEMDAINKEWATSPVLDVYEYNTQATNIVNRSNCPYMASDNLHFTKFAYALYGDDIADYMIKNNLFSYITNDEVELLMNSDEFKLLLEKYYRSNTFMDKLDDATKELVKALLGIEDDPSDDEELDKTNESEKTVINENASTGSYETEQGTNESGSIYDGSETESTENGY